MTPDADVVQDLAEGRFLTIDEAAQFLAVSRSKVYQMMDGGKLPNAKFGKSRRIPRQGLLEYARRAVECPAAC